MSNLINFWTVVLNPAVLLSKKYFHVKILSYKKYNVVLKVNLQEIMGHHIGNAFRHPR